MPRITVNGQEIEAPDGDVLLKVCLDNGIDVPHYCYHPGLSPDGNCRMCLVETSTSRKLEVACKMNCSEGMEIKTETEPVIEARAAVLEYMLINHPLDCPVCDKAGECQLQDYTFQHRKGHSRFEESKVIRHTKVLGPHIKIWGNRCIACNRCERFCNEITGTGELALVNRGDHSVIDVHPDFPIDNPMSLNTVDICPVGALIDTNFLYQSRVWFTDRPTSVCTSCSRGCNITATVRENVIHRLQPRDNPEVNDYWMCDHGRLNIGMVAAKNRLKRGKGTIADAVNGLASLRGTDGSIAILVSTGQTVEDLFVVKKLAAALGAPVGFYTKTEGERWVAKNGFAIETDKTPNTAGAEHVFGGSMSSIDQSAAIFEGLASGAIRGLVSINAIPDFSYPQAVIDAAGSLDLLVMSDIATDPIHEHATVLFASATWAERTGTFINRDRHVQRIRPLVRAPRRCLTDLEWLQKVSVGLDLAKTAISAEGIFRKAIDGLTYADVGELGVRLQPDGEVGDLEFLVPAPAPAGAAK